MSLKDKAKPLIVWNDFTPIQEVDSQTPLVKLSDAEQEIDRHRQQLETAQSTITSQAIQLERKEKEIQKLVGLLRRINSYRTFMIKELREEITQTLKNYENRG